MSLDAEENVADVFWLPLVVTIAGFVALFVALVLLRTRTEISPAPRPRADPARAHGLMPDLGAYAVEVLSAYAVTLALLGGLVGVSVWQARRARARLGEVERRGRRE